MKLIQMTSVEANKNVIIVKLNRPEKKNAISLDMISEFHQVLDHIEQNHNISVVIIEGKQDSFSVGADLEEVSNYSSIKEFYIFLDDLQNLFMRIKLSKKIFIASLEGYVLGGGLELALHCDIRISSETTVISMPEIKVGLLPGAGGIYDLVKLVGTSKTLELICLGEKIDAMQALSLNIINQISSSKELREKTLKLAIKMATYSAPALQTAKTLVRNAEYSLDEVSGKQKEALFISMLHDTKEVEEGLLNFRKK